MFHEEQILVTSNQENKHIRYKDTVSVKTKTIIRYLCLLAYSGVQHIMCCGLFCLRLVYGGVQHIMCCGFFCLRLVYGGVQHIMCCGFFLSSPCAWWCPTYYVLWFFLSSPCVWWCPTYYVLWFSFVFAIRSFTTNKTVTYYVGKQSPCLGQAQKCGRVKPVNWIKLHTCIKIHSN